MYQILKNILAEITKEQRIDLLSNLYKSGGHRLLSLL